MELRFESRTEQTGMTEKKKKRKEKAVCHEQKTLKNCHLFTYLLGRHNTIISRQLHMEPCALREGV